MSLVESKYFKCEQCREFAIRLLFTDEVTTPEGVRDFAVRNKRQYEMEECEVWVIGPPTDLTDEDCVHLTTKIWPQLESSRFIKPSDFRNHIMSMEENHCKDSAKNDREALVVDLDTLANNYGFESSSKD